MFDFHSPFEKLDSKVWLSSPTMHGEELKYVTEAYETNWMSTVGENINEVERMVAEKIGVRYAVALSAGTTALHLAMKLAGETLYGKPVPGTGALCGKYVAASDMTFSATVNPIVYEGGIPVFIDTEYDTWNMDPAALEKALRRYNGKAMINSVNGKRESMEAIFPLVKKYGGVVIALTLDEEGIPETAEGRLRIAEKILKINPDKFEYPEQKSELERFLSQSERE